MRFDWKHLFWLWALQGVLAFAQLASLESDSESGVLFGFSASRLALFGFLLIWIAASIWLTSKRFDTLVESNWILLFALILAIGSQATLAVLYGLSQRGLIYAYNAYAARLSPLLNLITLSMAEFLVWMILRRRQSMSKSGKDAERALVKPALVAWGILGVLALFISNTGLGIVPDVSGEWGLPGVALLEWQAILALTVAVVIIHLESKNIFNFKRADVYISFAIWLATVALWLGQPIAPSISATEPRAPNYEIYPYIDAQIYDEYAQSILIGNGMRGIEVAPRPLYVTFLAFTHALVGQAYEDVILVQTLLLALLPVALYLFGKTFNGRGLGVALAALAALRDITSNLVVGSAENLSYSKLYLSEIPVGIALIIFIYLGIRWAKNNYPNYIAFVAGCVLGAGILIRTQAVTAFPVLLFLAWLADRRNFSAFIRGGLIMGMGIALVVSPWLFRNWINHL